MPVDGEEDCKQIAVAFRKAAMVFEPNTVQLLTSHLEEKYNIRFGSSSCSSLDDIETALFDIAGPAAAFDKQAAFFSSIGIF